MEICHIKKEVLYTSVEGNLSKFLFRFLWNSITLLTASKKQHPILKIDEIELFSVKNIYQIIKYKIFKKIMKNINKVNEKKVLSINCVFGSTFNLLKNIQNVQKLNIQKCKTFMLIKNSS